MLATTPIVRLARPGDEADLARLSNHLNVEMGQEDGAYTSELLTAQLFGDQPLFEVLVAEVAGRVAGYASFQPFYDSDLAEPGVWLIDLIVDPAARGGGLGRLLMAELARLVQARGGRSLTWGVLNSNHGAIKFYRELGALDAEARILELKGEALAAVAARA